MGNVDWAVRRLESRPTPRLATRPGKMTRSTSAGRSRNPSATECILARHTRMTPWPTAESVDRHGPISRRYKGVLHLDTFNDLAVIQVFAEQDLYAPL